MSENPIVPEKRPCGRPSKLTPELMKKLVRHIRWGSTYESASRACGIHRNTRLNWMARGEKEAERIENGEPPYLDEALFLEFYYQADQADAIAECEDIKYIRQAKPGWGAKAWLWSRKNPACWGIKGRIEHAGDFGQPIQNVIRVVDA
jgi:hypothetical protein